MRLIPNCSAVILLLLVLSAEAQQTVTEVIESRSGRAQELLPVVRSLVTPGGSVSVFENKLVVRATPEQMTEVKRVLATLDTPARQLLISVRQDGSDEERRRSVGISGKQKLGGGAVVVPRPDGTVPKQPTLEINDQQNRSQTGGSEQVRTLEGHEAQIHVGQTVPYVNGYKSPGGGVTNQVEFHDVLTGFTVVPRLRGKQVELEISPRQERLITSGGSSGSIKVERISTTVSGPLGEWFDIGGAVQSVSAQSSGLLSRGSSSEQTQRSVLVKVEEVR